ncbi:hypothetical protein JCM8097_003392 [Rhodosporidiobolus ruineniae]
MTAPIDLPIDTTNPYGISSLSAGAGGDVAQEEEYGAPEPSFHVERASYVGSLDAVEEDDFGPQGQATEDLSTLADDAILPPPPSSGG